MTAIIPLISGKFSGRRFLKGAGAVLNLMPPPPQHVVAPPPRLLTPEEAIAAAWLQVGRDISLSIEQVGSLIQSGHAAR